MATGFTTKAGNGEYRLQFETDNREYYLLMQSTARRCVDGGHIKKYKLLSQAIIFALIIIAAWVAVTIAAGKSAWILIIIYWIVLTAKNIVDLIVFQKTNKKEIIKK